MLKSTEQISHEVMAKLATSRWREAIRSGEVIPGPEAESLKTRMGVDPVREAEGLIQGWKGQARARGYTPMEIRPTSLARAGLGALRGDAAAKASLHQQGQSLAGLGMMASPAGVLPGPKMTATIPALEFPLVSAVSKRHGLRYLADPGFRRQVRGSILGHEGSELSASRKVDISNINKGYNVYRSGLTPEITSVVGGVGAGATRRLLNAMGKGENFDADLTKNITLHSPQSGIMAGRHANPEVVLNEIRNNRMLSPDTQDFMKKLRQKTTEWGPIEQLGGKNPILPRRQLHPMAKSLAAGQMGREKALGSLFDEGLKSPLQGLKALMKSRIR